MIVNVDHLPGDLTVPSFGPRMVCTECGTIGADVRPNWQERPQRETLTGVQWKSGDDLVIDGMVSRARPDGTRQENQ